MNPLLSSSLSKRIELSAVTIDRTAKVMKQNFARILAQHPEIDVTVDQWVILQFLHNNGPTSQNELALSTHKDAPTITKIIDLLVQKGHVTRKTSETDRRRFVIQLNKSGNRLYRTIMPLVYEYRNVAYQGITESELKSLETILNKIKENLTQPLPNKN